MAPNSETIEFRLGMDEAPWVSFDTVLQCNAYKFSPPLLWSVETEKWPILNPVNIQKTGRRH